MSTCCATPWTSETALAHAEVSSEAKFGRRHGDRPRRGSRGSLLAHLERIEQLVDFENKACPCCGGALHQIGEGVAERLDVVPTTTRVLVTRRPRYGGRSCESTVVQAPAPTRIVEGGIPTEALIARFWYPSMSIICRFFPARAQRWALKQLLSMKSRSGASSAPKSALKMPSQMPRSDQRTNRL